ncbi:MAG: myxosortase-dependent M36 family metallopeptidase [Myxococcota bacterium]
MRKHWLLALVASVSSLFTYAAPALRDDAFLAAPPDRPLAVDATSLAARGAQVAHEEQRLGVPTFVWLSGFPAEATPEKTAKSALAQLAEAWRVDAAEIERLSVRELHRNERTGAIVRFAQTIDGVGVFRGQFDVLLNRSGAPVAVSGYPVPSAFARAASRSFAVSGPDAVSKTFKALTGQGATFAVTARDDEWARLSLMSVAGGGWHLASAPRVRKVYFLLADRLEPAWHVELNVGGEGSNDSAYVATVVSARDGAFLFKTDLTADASYRVWADPTSLMPYDSPFGTAASPHPTGTPNGFQPNFVPSNLVSATNLPYSRNDPWLPTGATSTTGNNVDAYADVASPDGFTPNTIDLRPTSTTANTFDYLFDVNLSPAASSTQRSAAATQLFYDINFLHDWFYDFGFDEVAGNAQTFNYGRGGREADFIRAEAQDSSGRNNANMSTPADGAPPRMQMYIFDGVAQLNVNSPAAVAGRVDANTASFGASTFNLTGDLKLSGTVETACTAFAPGFFANRIALVDRGTCAFAIKALNAQNAGALGVIIANNAAGAAPGLGGTDPTITIPVLSTTQATAAAWRAEFTANASTINVTMKRTADLDRDGALDNDIIAHEWGHYLSNRLIGNSVGLTNNQGRSMGEGWSDFVALLQLVRDEDRTMPGNNLFQGVYAAAVYSMVGGLNQGAYYGIRRVPYSTDFTKNALTFKHITNNVPLPATHPVASGANGAFNAEVHNSGEVWASMLWECYASLLNAYPFQEAQNRMKAYLVAALKMTPVSPTMLEARDALLAVAASVDPADYTRFLTAFAKRGAGVGALGPDRASADHVTVVESFNTGSAMRVLEIALGDDVVGCDQDGILDVNETGTLRVRVANLGRTALAAQSMTVAASGATATITFPSGNTASIPSLPAGTAYWASVPVRLTATTGATPRAGLTMTFNEPTLPPSATTATYDGPVNYDENLGSSASDAFETRVDPWLSFGFTRGGGIAHANDSSAASEYTLTTPWLQVNATGNFVVTFKERHSFEWDGTKFWDGAVFEFTTDGVTWLDVFEELNLNPGYTGFLEQQDGFPLAGRAAWVNQNTGFPAFSSRTVNFGTNLAGRTVRLRFRVASDSSVGAYGLDVDDFAVTNVANTPFASMSAEVGGTCNRRPVAVISAVSGVEGTLASNVLTRTPIQLNGTSSFDPDGTALTYTWTQLGGPTATLTGANTATPSFTADVARDSYLTFQLVVSDGTDSSLPARVEVVVRNVNQKPVAVATGPATVAEDSATPVTLSGSGSTDADGETLTYAWTQTAGPTVQLSSTTDAAPTFAVPAVTADTTLTFSLTVNDGLADSETASTVSVVVTNVDRAPTVNAGVDLTAAGRTTITLAALGSDPDGDTVSYAWTQVSGTAAMLTNANTAAVSIATPDIKTAEDLVFQVTATANARTATDTVTVHVLADAAPFVSAGIDFTTPGRATTTLQGVANDPEGDAITFAWTQVSGATVMLMNASSATPTFLSPDVKMPATLVFRVTATANGLSASDTVSVTVEADRAPTVTVSNRTVDARSMVALAGFASDPEGDALTWAWTQTSGPTVMLTGADTASPSFVAPDVASGTEAVVLHAVVTANGLTGSADATITVRAANRQPVVAGLNDVTEKERVSLTLTASAVDPDGDAITWHWTQTGGPSVTLAGDSTDSVTFTTPEVSGDTRLTFAVEATDPSGEKSSATVGVTVQNVNRGPTAKAVALGGGSDPRITLSAAGSADPDGDALTFAWKQTSGPSVTFNSTDAEVVSFQPPKVDTATVVAFEVTVSDGSETATAQVSVGLEPSKSGGGCGCTTGVEGLPLAFAALVLGLRRRRS